MKEAFKMVENLDLQLQNQQTIRIKMWIFKCKE